MSRKQSRIDITKITLGILSGLFLTGSFPSIDFSWLSWVALVPLFMALHDLSPQKSFKIGLLAGCVHFASLLYWLAYTMQTYGNMPFYYSIPTLLLLSVYLGFYTAVFSAATRWLLTAPLGFLLFTPVFWVALEYIRSFLITGFPWGLLSYSQYNHLHLIQISDILGPYGVSYLIVQTNGVCFLGYSYLKGLPWQGKRVGTRLAIGSMVLWVCLFTITVAYGRFRIESIDRWVAVSPLKTVSVVQGNIDQAIKWDPQFQEATTQKYVDLSHLTKHDQPDLIVWPETAAPFYFGNSSPLTQQVQRGIIDVNTDFLIGSPSFVVKENKAVEYYNSAYLINETGKITGKYDKAHLVPFGEYVPLKKLLPFIGKLVAQVGDFSAGEKGKTLRWADGRLGILICYEIIFPDLSRMLAKNHASFLVNMTNDAWYGKSSAPYQHFSMAIFRAVENRRVLVRSANTGISGFIDPVGRVIRSSEIFEEAVITESIPMIEKLTFYTRFGNVFASGCLIFLLCMLVVKGILFYKK